MNNIKFLHKIEKEYKRKHNTDYSCLESLLNLYVKFWKYSKDSRHKKSYLRRILNTYIKLIKFNIDNICGYSVNIDNNITINVYEVLENNIGALSVDEIWKFYYEIAYKR